MVSKLELIPGGLTHGMQIWRYLVLLSTGVFWIIDLNIFWFNSNSVLCLGASLIYFVVLGERQLWLVLVYFTVHTCGYFHI
jgi:hypothetical protein